MPLATKKKSRSRKNERRRDVSGKQKPMGTIGLRLPSEYVKAVEALESDNPEIDFSTHLRIAVREYLIRKGKIDK